MGSVQWESHPPKCECPHHFGVTVSSLWGDVLEKDQEKHSRVHSAEHTLVFSEPPRAHTCSSSLELEFVVLCY